jgi:tRNA (guanine37-N1)-methyltransferase
MARMLKNVLIDTLSSDEINKLYSSFDIIGDIVIIKIPECLNSKKHIIANTLLNKIKPVNTIFQQISPVKGDYRIRKLEFLAGEEKTITEYKEHGCIFKVDVSKTYFSPRLSTERLRIAKLIEDREVIVNMFAGIGTYSIILAKKNPDCIIYNIDSNPTAIELCVTNSRLNKVENRVIPILGDATQVIQNELRGLATRVLMPLPERAYEFVESAILSLKNKKGIIHFFAHIKSNNKERALDAGTKYSMNIFKDYQNKINSCRVIREVGPRIYQIVTDIDLF